MATRFGISRKDQDEYTVLSHHRAAKAHADGIYTKEIVPVDGKTAENGIKADTSMEKVAKLPPAFIKPHGTHTAANSSFLTDGASAVLLMSEEKALQLGYKPLSYVSAWTYVGLDPFEELLLGPTFAVEKVLREAKLTLADMGVIEFHEAFAGQVLSNMAAMDSKKFAEERFASKTPVGRMNMDIVNIHGGSLSIGHPFGATGGRLVTTASNRLQRENKKYALLVACADGGLAHACILERYENK
jgi:acetyl-CoA acyltransferase